VEITVNGEHRSLDGPATVAELLKRFDVSPQRVAVEVNEQLVRRARLAEVELRDGDRVEIVTLVGGG
jgi:thiamine biosynthesis protein ThiS